MRYSVDYPNKYNADLLLSHQSAVPSQQTPMGIAYSPDQAIGVYPAPETVPGTAPGDSYTVYTWDSRPPQGSDFSEVFSSNDGPFQADYTVPDGFVAILRHISGNIYIGTGAAAVVNPDGSPASFNGLSIVVDGNAVPNWGNGGVTDISEAATGTYDFDTWVVAQGGSTISVLFARAGVAATVGWTVNMYGQLLLASGRSLTLEYGNEYPVPVTMASASPDTNIGV